MSRYKKSKKKRKLTKKFRKSLFRFSKGGVNSPKHSQILEYLFNEYRKNPDFASDPIIHQYINQNYAPSTTGFNKNKHLELLRLIAFEIEKKSNTPQYLEFLKTLLFSLLEEPGISHQHTLSRKTNPALYSKLNQIEPLYSPYSSLKDNNKSFLFKDPQRDLSISNTQLHQFAEILQNNPNLISHQQKDSPKKFTYKRKRESPNNSPNKTKKF
jgi:hypothetical protein